MATLPKQRVFSRVFGEAFMLMKYRHQKTGQVEWVWNSRDGVSPFLITAPGETALNGYMNHEDWGEDVLVPNFVPPIGMRVFIDHHADPTGKDPDNVKLITVDAEWHALFRDLAEQLPFKQSPRTGGDDGR